MSRRQQRRRCHACSRSCSCIWVTACMSTVAGPPHTHLRGEGEREEQHHGGHAVEHQLHPEGDPAVAAARVGCLLQVLPRHLRDGVKRFCTGRHWLRAGAAPQAEAPAGGGGSGGGGGPCCQRPIGLRRPSQPNRLRCCCGCRGALQGCGGGPGALQPAGTALGRHGRLQGYRGTHGAGLLRSRGKVGGLEREVRCEGGFWGPS